MPLSRQFGFLLFAIGLALGAWIAHTFGPERKQLELQVECAPVERRI
jgi:hypothetical protein